MLGTFERVTGPLAQALFEKGTTIAPELRKQVADRLATDYDVKLGEDQSPNARLGSPDGLPRRFQRPPTPPRRCAPNTEQFPWSIPSFQPLERF